MRQIKPIVKTQLYQDEWISMPEYVRAVLKKELHIHVSEGSRVVNNKVVSDGVSQETLCDKLSVEAMQAYTASKEKDFMKLLDHVIKKAEVENLKKVIAVEEAKQAEAREKTEQVKKIDVIAELKDKLKLLESALPAKPEAEPIKLASKNAKKIDAAKSKKNAQGGNSKRTKANK